MNVTNSSRCKPLRDYATPPHRGTPSATKFLLIATLICGALSAPSRGVAQTAREAAVCRRAESAEACFRRGLELAESAGVERKHAGKSAKADVLDSEALSLFRQACSRDEGDACYFAGRLVATPRQWPLDRTATGSGPADSAITASLAEATTLFRKGCYAEKRPSAAACTALDDGYFFGIGQPVQLDSSLKVGERGCMLGYDVACLRWGARINAKHPEYGPERTLLAYKLAQKACASGSSLGCYNEAYVIDTALAHTPEAERHTAEFRRKAQMLSRLYNDSCRKWLAVACNSIGALFQNGRYGVPSGLDSAQRLDSALHYYTLACDGVPIRIVGRDTTLALGEGWACWNLGNLAISTGRPDTAAALVQYRKGCLLFEPLSCAELALKEYMLHHDSADVALLRSVTACNEGLGTGCNYAAWLLREPYYNQAPEALAQSLVYFRRACDLSYGWSCYRLGQLETDDSRRAKWYRRVCDLRESYGCNALASLLENHFGQQDRAVVFYEQACDEGMAKACWTAKGIRRARDDALSEGLDRTKACHLDEQYCKKPDRSS